MKGVVEAISTLLISGILIGVVGTVYFWGLPLIQKNKDISVLESNEDFMYELNNKIKLVANAGGREQIQFTQPGVIRFDSVGIRVVIDTEGTIYAAEAPVPLSRNSPALSEGVWGIDQPEIISVLSNRIGDTHYRNTFKLSYKSLVVNAEPAPDREFLIQLSGTDSVGGQGSNVIITSEGTSEETFVDKTRINSVVKITID